MYEFRFDTDLHVSMCPMMSSGWYFGCNIRKQDEKGIFPKTHVKLKEVISTKSGCVFVILKNIAILLMVQLYDN